jgi:2'-5' RNA ligase
MRTDRLFFALWLPPEVRDAVVAARDAVPARAGRLTDPRDLHVTLVFVGAVDAALLPCIEAAAADVVSAPFRLTLRSLGNWRRTRLWVAEPGDVPAALPALVERLQRGLLRCGLPPETRPYRAHVTVARKAPAIEGVPLGQDDGLGWQVGDFVLAASGRRDPPPAYRVLRRWPLAAGRLTAGL